jgi:ferredoxin
MPTLRFLPAGRELQVSRSTPLIEAIREAGLPIARACGEELICGKCGVRILEGRVSVESAKEQEMKRRNRVAPELRLACVIRVYDDLVLTADYWGECAG